MGKNLIRITLVSILILILSISFFACKRSKGVTDPNLAEAERAELGKTGNEEVNTEDAKSMNKLFADDMGIKEISGLEQAVSLQNLSLNNNEITDISPLAKLTELKVLNLNNNQISNISP